MSYIIKKYPAKSVINPALGQFLFTRIYNNPISDSFQFINRPEGAGNILITYDRIRVVLYVGLSLAPGAQVDDIIFILQQSPGGPIRRWCFSRISNSPSIPITQNSFAFLDFTIKDPPFSPVRLDLRFDVINPVYPAGTTSTLVLQILEEGYRI
jgi:hypothetical protein